MHKFSTAAPKSSALTTFRSVGLLNVPYSTFAGASVARLVRSALSALRDENLCIIRASGFLINLGDFPILREPTRRFVFSRFSSRLEEIAEEQLDFQDSKSLLQEQLHARGFTEPTYQVVEELGPDHSKKFVVEVHIEDKLLAKASGRSKKEAQQKAAGQALEGLEDLLD